MVKQVQKSKALSNVKRKNANLPKSARIYFPGRDEKTLKQLQEMGDKYGMTDSKIGVLAIRLGLPLVEKNLKGLLLNIEVQAEDHKNSGGLFTA